MAGQRRHPEWFSEGIMMVGNWEPLSFRRRAGQARFDEHDIYLREHDPKTIGRLKNLGINLIVTHFYKGFGAEAEAVEMERAARLVQEAHHHGMRVGAYLRFDAAVADTVERENSSAADWWQQDAGGGVRTYRGQDFRHLICPNHDTAFDVWPVANRINGLGSSNALVNGNDTHAPTGGQFLGIFPGDNHAVVPSLLSHIH